LALCGIDRQCLARFMEEKEYSSISLVFYADIQTVNSRMKSFGREFGRDHCN
jgi:hypothetical protein